MIADYQQLADRIGRDIASGELRPGDRLPPQRAFAYQHGIAVSTAGRVYAELLRRGLVVGEVGRGTFVAARKQSSPTGLPHDTLIDLEFNYPTIPEQAILIGRAMAGLQRADMANAATSPYGASDIAEGQNAVRDFLKTRGWAPSADAIVFTGSGRQSLAAALSLLASVGDRVGVEALSYPMVRPIAQRLGITLVPLAMDAGGLDPEAIARAHRKTPLRAIYVQPVMHNPLGLSMNPARRSDIVRQAKRLGIMIIEDLVYGFLSDAEPISAVAPDQCVVVDSLSKRLAPGIAVGWLHVPGHLREQAWSNVRWGAWTTSPLAMHLGTRLLQDGSARDIVTLKRVDAIRRQDIIRSELGHADLDADPASCHAWLRLPGCWRADQFVAAAAREGVAITPASAFAMAVGHAPPAVRLALGRPSHEQLATAAVRLATLLGKGPETVDLTE